jgi:cytochrome c oxidase subunit II
MPAPTLQTSRDSVKVGGMPRRTLVPTVIAALIATGIGIFLGLAVISWFPVQASVQAHNTDRLYYVLICATVPIFVLVVTVILYSVWQFRMKPGEELRDGVPIHGNTRLELVWTIVPAILILGLVSYSFVVLHDNEVKPAGQELQVNVTGQQFLWSYQYPPTVKGGRTVSSTILYLPDNQSVRFNMVSKDVIHAFWIPAFRLQEDVVPGITTHYRVTPDRLGRYPVVCNLLCGIGHSLMRSTVVVLPPARFKQWPAGQQGSSA